MDRPSARRPAALSTGAGGGEDAGSVPAAAEGVGESSQGRAGGGGGRAAGAGVHGGQGDGIEPQVAMYSWAGQAEMVRAGQKDELYTSMLQDMLLESAQTIVGQQASRQWDVELRAASDVAYHSLTTLRGVQTLGEEYCDIQEVESASETFPTAGARVTLVLWKTLFKYLFSLFQTRIIRLICQPHTPGQSRISAGTRAVLQEILPQIRGVGDAVIRCHKAIFYVYGTYLSMAHRLSEVRHVSLVQGSGGGGTPYALLGWCILVEQVVSLLMLGSKVVKLRQRAAREEGGGVALEGGEGEANVNEVEQGGKCMLCLEMRRATTATSCGHLFCWQCIAEWCSSKAECPLCRQKITHKTLLRISGYVPVPPPEA